MYRKELIGQDYKGGKSDLTAWRNEHKCRDNSTDLTRWMEKNKLVDEEVAIAVGVTRPYLNKVRNGGVTPNLPLALAIWDYTRREVPIEQLLPREYRPRVKALPVKPAVDPKEGVALTISRKAPVREKAAA